MSKTSDSRLKIKQGKLYLCYPTLPDLGCLMQDLDENGCCGIVLFQYLPEAVAADWRKILQPRRPLSIKLDVPPWLDKFDADALVQGVRDEPGRCEVEVRFNQLRPDVRMHLHHAVLAMALQKIRKDPPGADLKPAALEQIPAGGPAPVAANSPPASAPQRSGETSTVLRLKRIGEVLVHMGLLTAPQLNMALQHSRQNRERLGRYLVRTGLVAPDALCRALALQSGLPMTDLSDAELPEDLTRRFGLALMARHSFIPFDEAKTFVCVATFAPPKAPLIEELEKLCGKKIEVFLAQEEQVLKFLDGLQLKSQRKSRKFVRYDMAIPVQYQFCSRLGTPAEQVVHEGQTLNISEGGLLVEGTRSALGTPEELRRRGICVRIVLNSGAAHEVKAICQLRSVREKERRQTGSSSWMLGLELVEMAAEHRRFLKELCVKAVLNKNQFQ